ncbi:MAG: hypothetical protein ACOX5G_08465 [Kiritimatiellia bacterium]|jgi:chromosome segregation ATPase
MKPFPLWTACLSVFLVLRTLPAPAQDLEALDKAYGELAGEIAGEQMDFLDRKEAAERCFSDPKYETEATADIRKRIASLKAEVRKAEEELRAEIAKHPEVKAKLDGLAKDREALAAKLDRLDELKAQRAAARKAAQPKPRPKAPVDAE